MAEYINREELLKDIEDSVRFSTRNGVSAELRGAHKIVDCIRSATACDVVEVVRCKDCRTGKGNTPKMGTGWIYCNNNDQYHKETHFCSYGERRSENENT
jgi:hypothetical protein